MNVGPYETLRARLMDRCIVLLIVGATLSAPVQLLAGPPALALLPAGYAALYAAALYVLRSGRQQAAATIAIAASVVSLGVMLVPLGGVRGTGAVFVGPLALVAILWLDWRPALVAVLAAVALLAATPALDAAIDVPSVWSGVDPTFALTVSHAMATAFAAVLVGTTSDALHATSQEAEAREEEAARAAAAAQAASASKASFLATMSHELRTPLNAILGYAELLREDGGADTADLERIEAAGRHLLALVDDVLEMARSDSTPRPLHPEVIDLLELVRGEIARLPAGVPITVRGGSSAVRTDRSHVARVVAAVLARAAGLGGTVDVTVEHGAIVVRDGGALAPDALARLFEPFARVPGADPTGLGLAVSRRLAERLGATLEAASTERGTTLSLRLTDVA